MAQKDEHQHEQEKHEHVQKHEQKQHAKEKTVTVGMPLEISSVRWLNVIKRQIADQFLASCRLAMLIL
jgi:5-formyltetrahydrofolate cyclo-ligase